MAGYSEQVRIPANSLLLWNYFGYRRDISGDHLSTPQVSLRSVECPRVEGCVVRGTRRERSMYVCFLTGSFQGLQEWGMLPIPFTHIVRIYGTGYVHSHSKGVFGNLPHKFRRHNSSMQYPRITGDLYAVQVVYMQSTIHAYAEYSGISLG